MKIHLLSKKRYMTANVIGTTHLPNTTIVQWYVFGNVAMNQRNGRVINTMISKRVIKLHHDVRWNRLYFLVPMHLCSNMRPQ